MSTARPPDARAQELLGRLRQYCLPGGDDAARAIRGVRTTQRGQIRSSANASWLGFTAEEEVDATRSRFSWVARTGSGLLTSVMVTDAYEDGHGRLVIKKGPIQLKKIVGPDADRGELQRYLGYVSLCPPMTLNNPFLEWTSTGASTLRVTDVTDPAAASVEIEVGADGRPVVSRAERPMIVGKQTIMTPWSATGSDDRLFDGLRVPTRLEASWHVASGPFTYIRVEVLTFAPVR